MLKATLKDNKKVWLLGSKYKEMMAGRVLHSVVQIPSEKTGIKYSVAKTPKVKFVDFIPNL